MLGFFFSPNLSLLSFWNIFLSSSVSPLLLSVHWLAQFLIFCFSWSPSVCSIRTFLLQTVLSLSIPSQPSPIWDQCAPRLSLCWPSARTHICVCLLSVFRGPLNSALAGPDTLTSPLRPTEWRKVIRFPYPCQTRTHTHSQTCKSGGSLSMWKKLFAFFT